MAGVTLDSYKKVLNDFYPRYRYTWEIYSGKLRGLAPESGTWLDAGCGKNAAISEFPTVCSVGMDLRVDPNLENRERFVRGDLGSLPFRDCAFDLVTANFVVEHLDYPVAVFKELSRVLEPGGHLLIRTSNRLNYFFFIASLAPTRLKTAVAHAVYGRDVPVHRARYRLNNPAALKRICRVSGLALEEMTMNESLHFVHPLVFAVSLFVEWVLSVGPLENLRNTIIAAYRKPG